MNGKIVLSVLTAFIITFLSFFIFYDIFNESAKAFSEHQFFTQEFNTKIKKIFIFGSSHVGQLNTPYINEIISGPYEDYIVYNTASAADDPRERLENLHLLISLKPEIVFYGISYRDFHTPLLEDEFSFDIKQLSKEIISDDNPILKINPKFTTLQLIRNSFSDTSLFSKDRFYPEAWGIGIFFILQGIYYIVQPTTVELRDTLGFPRSFRPFVIAAVSLVIGVHFLRGKAYRPDQNGETQPERTNSKGAQSWWTGEYLHEKTHHENDS